MFLTPAACVLLLTLTLQYYLGYRIASYKMQNAEVSDGRVLRMHEVGGCLLACAMQLCGQTRPSAYAPRRNRNLQHGRQL